MSSPEYYDQYWTNAGHNPRDVRLPAVVEQLLERHVPNGASLIDVGCGAGDKIREWVKQQSLDYTGVDISVEAVHAASESGLNAITVEDVERLPFADHSFDFAISFEVMEHLFAPLSAMKEVRRVLRPGGSVIITVPNTAYLLKRAQMLRGIWNPGGDSLSVAEPWRDPHIRFFTLQSLCNMSEEAGFTVMDAGGHQDYSSGAGLSYKARFRNSDIYRRLEIRYPGLFSQRLHLVGKKQA